jgi:hypothetical protein
MWGDLPFNYYYYTKKKLYTRIIWMLYEVIFFFFIYQIMYRGNYYDSYAYTSLLELSRIDKFIPSDHWLIIIKNCLHSETTSLHYCSVAWWRHYINYRHIGCRTNACIYKVDCPLFYIYIYCAFCYIFVVISILFLIYTYITVKKNE